MPPKLVIMTARNEDLEFCQKLAQQIGFESLNPRNPIELEKILQEERHSVVMFDVDHANVENRLSPLSNQHILAVTSKHLPSSRVFALSNKNLFELPHLSRVLSIGHYCVRNYDSFAFEWMSKTIAPVFGDDPCDLRHFIDSGVVPLQVKLSHSHKKIAALEGITKLLLQKGVQSRCVDVATRALDELLMNAIFDAPVDSRGRTYRKATDRADGLYLDGREEIDISIALNKTSVVLCVQDQFGSFSQKAALSAMQKDYSENQYHADATVKAAGLGLQGIASSGIGFLLNVKPNLKTQAILTFPYFQSYKSMRTSFRSFSLNLI